MIRPPSNGSNVYPKFQSEPESPPVLVLNLLLVCQSFTLGKIFFLLKFNPVHDAKCTCGSSVLEC